MTILLTEYESHLPSALSNVIRGSMRESARGVITQLRNTGHSITDAEHDAIMAHVEFVASAFKPAVMDSLFRDMVAEARA